MISTEIVEKIFIFLCIKIYILVWDRCPSGFTCYSNFPDGRSAHCCTTVPLDNQVVCDFDVNQKSDQGFNFIISKFPEDKNNLTHCLLFIIKIKI